MGLDSINVKALATCSYTFRASILVSTNIRLPSLNQDSMSISTKHTFSAYDSQHYFHGDVTLYMLFLAANISKGTAVCQVGFSV